MMNKTLILILFTLTFSFARGQNPQVRREIKIVYSFDYDSMRDGKLYLTRKGTIKTDTTTSEYNRDGSLKNRFPNPFLVTWGKTIFRDSIVLISEEKNIKHQREYWSDSSSIDIYIQNFRDSTIKTKVIRNDTIQIKKSFFHKGQLVKIHNRNFRKSDGKFNEIITYDKKTKNREVATIIGYNYGFNDTVRIDNMKKLYKNLVLNPHKNEWFVKEKTKFYRRKKVLWETFYHTYHKMYFTKRTTTEYNKMGQPITETKYDTYLRHIEKKTTYKYEYY